MPATPSVMSLYLHYRLWIAELNFDINVLRIIADFLTEFRTKRKEAEVKSKSDYFEKEFQTMRSEIDEIRHEMQLSKMKLGAYSRDGKPFDFKIFKKESFSPLKKRLTVYRAHFKKIRFELKEFEAQWVS